MPPNEKNSAQWWKEPMLVFVRISVWIAGPIIIALFIGNVVDEKLGSAPWGFLAIVGFAFFVSCYGIFREVAIYIKNSKDKK